ncbi:ABC transporter permease [Izhakiella australiensis]|uniref:ABC transporter permease n=1 Tax=Izhakiella australiensis TaxID=1926881 RepID=A0A1S8YPR0_9GAMM|nr:ABC transporter permease [Izhakiella australiensis]OON41044.1 ABC transporter permease [Izhakiella australiensis]
MSEDITTYAGRTRRQLPRWLRQFLRHPGAVCGALIVVVMVAMALSADYFYPKNPLRIVAMPEIWPFTDPRYPLGTDSLGRDIAALIVHGARATLLIGLAASLAATLIGVSIGAAAAWFGGWVDETLMRVAELFQVIPNVVFVLTVVSVLGPHMVNIIIAVGLVSWQPIARLTRAEFLSWRDREFVQACRASGMADYQIVIKEIMPNVLPPVIVLASLVIAGAILYESVVSFLGLGDPNLASWGRLVGEGRTLIRSSWYICAVPGVAIMLAVLALNLVGDGLNDALNPKLRGRD